MTNWKAMQVPIDKDTKKPIVPHGIKPKYFAGGTYHADLSKKGAHRHPKKH